MLCLSRKQRNKGKIHKKCRLLIWGVSMVTVSEVLIQAGRSGYSGWGLRQLSIIGGLPKTQGWKHRAYGRQITEDQARLFIRLKKKPTVFKSSERRIAVEVNELLESLGIQKIPEHSEAEPKKRRRQEERQQAPSEPRILDPNEPCPFDLDWESTTPVGFYSVPRKVEIKEEPYDLDREFQEMVRWF